MSRIIRPMLVLAALAGAAVGTTVRADVTRSREDADQLLRKFALIANNGLAERPAPRRTQVTERELNSFLAFHARNDIPAGVMDPIVVIEPSGRLTGRAIVDLDEVKKAQSGAGFGMLSLLSGRVPVEATGTLKTSRGIGTFTLDAAYVSGVPVPKALLQEVVGYYSRTPENPEGIDLESPFTLPVGIREIQTTKGQAIVVQ